MGGGDQITVEENIEIFLLLPPQSLFISESCVTVIQKKQSTHTQKKLTSVQGTKYKFNVTCKPCANFHSPISPLKDGDSSLRTQLQTSFKRFIGSKHGKKLSPNSRFASAGSHLNSRKAGVGRLAHVSSARGSTFLKREPLLAPLSLYAMGSSSDVLSPSNEFPHHW